MRCRVYWRDEVDGDEELAREPAVLPETCRQGRGRKVRWRTSTGTLMFDISKGRWWQCLLTGLRDRTTLVVVINSRNLHRLTTWTWHSINKMSTGGKDIKLVEWQGISWEHWTQHVCKITTKNCHRVNWNRILTHFHKAAFTVVHIWTEQQSPWLYGWECQSEQHRMDGHADISADIRGPLRMIPNNLSDPLTSPFTETSEHLLDGLSWNMVQTFMFPTGWTLIRLVE